MVLRTSVIGTASTSERDKRCAAALKVLSQTMFMLNEKMGLSPDEIMSVFASATAMCAEAGDMKEDAAELLERWAELLRSGQTVSWTAEGNA